MRALRELIQSVKIADHARVEGLLGECPCLAEVNGLLHHALSSTPLGPLGVVLNRPSEADRRRVLELLLAHGADANATDAQGGAPLHLAARKGWKSVAETLLAHGAAVDAADLNGETPLFRAVAQGCEATTECLLAHGADPNAVNHSGETPLHRAVRSRRLSLLPILLSYEAVMEVADRQGLTPIQVAHDGDLESVSDIFSRYEGVRRYIGSFTTTEFGFGESRPSDPWMAPVRRPFHTLFPVGA